MFHEFDPRSPEKSVVYELTLCVSTVLNCIPSGIPRAMWAGIACMSVCLPFQKDLVKRAHIRWIYNILGCMIFLVIYCRSPQEAPIAFLGGIGVGYSAGYPWQTLIPSAPLCIASNFRGPHHADPAAFRLRRCLYTALMGSLIDRASDRLFCRK